MTSSSSGLPASSRVDEILLSFLDERGEYEYPFLTVTSTGKRLSKGNPSGRARTWSS